MKTLFFVAFDLKGVRIANGERRNATHRFENSEMVIEVSTCGSGPGRLSAPPPRRLK